MRAPNPSPPTPECIGDVEWLEVAAGLYPDAKTRELMKHAAQCGHCGPLLKNAAEALVDDPTPSEEAWLASLRSSRPEWRKNMAETLRGGTGVKDSGREKKEGTKWWQTLFSWPRPAFVFAGVTVAVIAGWLGVRVLYPPSAEQLLAQAYAEHRTLEVRIRGAKYAPMRVERTAGGSSLDKPPSLLKAEALIGENLRKNPTDPAWLQAKARADLLDGNYESAIKSLQRALETQPDDSGLLTDLGSAYFVRAEAADRPIDYGNAIESLGKALAKSPDDPVALFNRALACERIFLYAQAIEDWEHYLRVDPTGGWAEEAKKRLATVQEKVKRKEQSMLEPLLSAKALSSAALDDQLLRAKINGRIEEYVGVALRDWLSPAYGGHDSEARRTYGRALRTLAEIAGMDHGDVWLRDLLSNDSPKSFSIGVQSLANALKGSDAGNYTQTLLFATRAEHNFAAAGNRAGYLRAHVEEIYALHLSHEGEACLHAVAHAAFEVEHSPYPWLQIQFHIEQSICEAMMGRPGKGQQLLKNAVRDAERSKYDNIYLRAVGNASDSESQAGDLPNAFTLAFEGLSRFWNSQLPAMQGYNLYTQSYAVAVAQKQPNLQVLIWQQALRIIDHDQDYLLRAMAHSTMARAALSAAMPEVAAKEVSVSTGLFARAPQTKATINDRVEAEVLLAEVENSLSEFDRAFARLENIRPFLETLSNNFLRIKFYSALGAVQFSRGADDQAVEAFERSVALSELALQSLKSERDRITWMEGAQASYRGLVELKLRHGDAQGALEMWEWYRAAPLRSGIRMASPNPQKRANSVSLSDLHEVTHVLPGLMRETVLSYALFPSGISIWLYDNRGVAHRWTSIPSSQTVKIAERFRDLCADPTSNLDELQRTGHELYTLLIEPVEDSIAPDRTLEIEADEPLTGLPLEALRDSQERYLGDRITILNSQGVYYRSYVHRPESISSSSPILITAVSTSDFSVTKNLPPLPEALKEGEEVAKRFVHVELLKDSQATTTALYRDLARAQIFHFAGHGISSPDGVLLALFDKPIAADSLPYSALTRLQIAILSACNTERGLTAQKVDSQSFLRKLTAAGVPYVIASRWSVDSVTTERFMESFYDNLLAGRTPAESVRKAQYSTRSNSFAAHPAYWAAFSAFGSSP